MLRNILIAENILSHSASICGICKNRFSQTQCTLPVIASEAEPKDLRQERVRKKKKGAPCPWRKNTAKEWTPNKRKKPS